MPHKSEGRSWEQTLANSEIDRHANSRLWPEERSNGEAIEDQWARVRGLPERERLALIVAARVNPLNTSERLSRSFCRAIAMVRGIGHEQRRRGTLVRRARMRLGPRER